MKRLQRNAWLLLTVVALFAPSALLFAWGFTAHKKIHEMAVEGLPVEMRSFFANNRAFVREHAIDPDLWVAAGDASEQPNHFLDMDQWDQPPFANIPRDENLFKQKFGAGAVEKGRVPWRIAEVYRQLIQSFKEKNWPLVLQHAATLGHYVADSHVPLHSVVNYDGQLTGQPGVHSRWERGMFERFEQQILAGVRPQPAVRVSDPVAFTFQTLASGFAEVNGLLAADKTSSEGLQDYLQTPENDQYSHTYYSKFFAAQEKVITQRFAESVHAVASLWLSAWTEAGRPVLPSDFKIPYVRGERRAVFIAWDGIHRELVQKMLNEGKLPNLARLKSRGVTAEHVTSNFPSKTAAAFASIWTGAYGNVNGITGNEVFRVPRSQFSILDTQSGFYSTGLMAEPLWYTAARQGLEAVVVQATQAYPFEPFTTGRKFGGNFQNSLVLFDGFANKQFNEQLITEKAGLRAPSGWSGLPRFTGEAFEFDFKIAQQDFFGLIFKSENASGYDTMIVTPRKNDPQTFVFLKPGFGTSPSENRFSNPIRISFGDESSYIYFRLFRLAPDGKAFLLYHTSGYTVKSNQSSLVRFYNDRAGGFVGDGASRFYGQSAFGPRLNEGGDGFAERCFVETLQLLNRQMARATEWAIRSLRWDVLFTYTPVLDHFFHANLAYLDSKSPVYNAQIAAKFEPFLEQVLRSNDQLLGAAMQAAPENTIVALVSDHGMRSVTENFYPNKVLRDHGLLVLDADGHVNLSKTKAFFAPSTNFSIVINTTDRKGGIVRPEEYDRVVKEVYEAMMGVKSPTTGKNIVTHIFDAAQAKQGYGMGGESGGNLYLDLAEYYYINPDPRAPVVERARIPSGEHGFYPLHPDMQTLFFAAGPGLKKNFTLANIDSIDIAPTISALLGIDPPRQARGKILQEALETKP